MVSGQWSKNNFFLIFFLQFWSLTKLGIAFKIRTNTFSIHTIFKIIYTKKIKFLLETQIYSRKMPLCEHNAGVEKSGVLADRHFYCELHNTRRAVGINRVRSSWILAFIASLARDLMRVRVLSLLFPMRQLSKSNFFVRWLLFSHSFIHEPSGWCEFLPARAQKLESHTTSNTTTKSEACLKREEVYATASHKLMCCRAAVCINKHLLKAADALDARFNTQTDLEITRLQNRPLNSPRFVFMCSLTDWWWLGCESRQNRGHRSWDRGDLSFGVGEVTSLPPLQN